MALRELRRNWARALNNAKYVPRIPAPIQRIAGQIGKRLDTRKKMELLCDVVGSCNLRCPSCPVGNIGPLNGTGLFDKDLFRRVIEKAAADFYISHVSLFNWAEPLLHPELPSLIEIVKRNRLPCAISSNLNILRNADEILAARPDWWRVSLSGFTQEVYGRTHAGGHIERVKENMRKLSSALAKMKGRRTVVEVYYHKYRHNLHEIDSMREFALGLGFAFKDSWAYFMPLEKVLDAAEGKLSDQEREFVEDKFALPIVDAINAAREFRHEPCRLFDEQIVLDLKGNLILCCGVYDYEHNRLGSFLDMSPADVVRVKSGHSTCERCTSHGLHRYGEFQTHEKLGPIYEDLVRKNLERPRKPVAAGPSVVGDPSHSK